MSRALAAACINRFRERKYGTPPTTLLEAARRQFWTSSVLELFTSELRGSQVENLPVASSAEPSQQTASSSVFPSHDKGRKSIPIFDGAVMYFPKALAAVAEVSRIGNDQHNPGKPLHWNRTTSMDQFNTALRHLVDHGSGYRHDSDGARHLAKAAWRILAALELDIEAEARGEPLAVRGAAGV